MTIDTSLAIVFPGQSTQRVGMLSSLASYYSLVEETFDEASSVLGYNIWKLIQNGPAQDLNKTCHAQPAILIASVAIWRIWKDKGGCTPKIMAGHSLGEYSALVCAQGIDFLSAVRLVMLRGMLMQEAAPYGYGSMSVIVGLNNEIVIKLCKDIARDQIVAPACFNTLEHTVIAGHSSAVSRVSYLCKNAGAKYILKLPISVPSHCVLMKSIVKKFREELEKMIIHIPNIPVVNNTDVSVENNPEKIRDALVRQLYTPVRWYDIVRYCINHKVEKFLEIGPGKTLTGLIKNITNNNIYSLSVNDPVSLSEALKVNT